MAKKQVFANLENEDTSLVVKEKKEKRKLFQRKVDSTPVIEADEESIVNENEVDLVSSIGGENDIVAKENTPNPEQKPKKISVAKGLSYDEVKERQEKGLVNKVTNPNAKTKRSIILKNVFTVFNILNILIAAALIAAGSWKNLLFLPIIVINTVIGIVQELKAKKTVESLSLISAPSVTVVRNGHKEQISAEEVVIDDILYLDAGKQIVADSVVRKGVVEVNESMLTGESDSIMKKAGSLLYSGSFVVSGDCYAKVERVGNDNYISQLSKQAKKYSKPKSEIMNSLSILIKIITAIVVVLGAVLFVKSYLFITAKDWRASIVYTAGAMIGMIPSGLFLMTSLSLAFGVIKLGKRNTLVQDLYCIEMLARVDVLCLDKTGTITDGSMKVRDVIEYPTDSPMTTKQAISFILGSCKESNATATALEKKFGSLKKGTTKAIVPFSSVRKYMAAYNDENKTTFIIGAPEFVLGNKQFESSSIALEVEKYARQGLRVLLLAKSSEKITQSDQLFEKVTPLALVTIEDVIRKDAVETIQYFKNSNVEVKVISGDNPLTVSKIAMRAGVENAQKFISLDGMSDDEVARVALKYTVFGRVNPKQKQIIIKTIKENGHTVAMTGDGVNDILALKEADCGIAMANGSEAARNVSHLVLLDSNFSSMPFVVREGRRVINNIKRVATMFLTKTIFSFLLTVLVVILNKSYPIQTIQLTLFDWFVVTIPSFYLALEGNNNQIKGKFLKDILLNALPGAIMIVVNYAIILAVTSISKQAFFPAAFDSTGALLANGQEIINTCTSTLTVLSTIAVGFVVLFRTCKPFNKGRGILYTVMLILFFVCLFSLGKVFEITPFSNLGITSILLVICLVLYTGPVYKLLSSLMDFIKNKSWMKLIK